MTRKIALIPVDARPVTYDLPKELGQLVDWELITPPKEYLGFLKEPANFSQLFQWIEDVSTQVEGVIVSIDMILYGGLVPSRINSENEAVIFNRLEQFLEIKQENPHLSIMAFSSTMRLSNSYVNEEEKSYWNQYGKEIWRYSYHSHRYQKLQADEDNEIVQEMKKEIPDWVLEDYLTTRERNFQVNLSLIEYIEQAVIDLLIFPQDDTSEYGLNIMEQEKLADAVSQQELYEKILIYPGADEVASVLTARMIYLLEKEPTPVFYPIYSGKKGSLSIAMYEDRAIDESIKGQIYAFGSHTVEETSDADVIIGVNVPGKLQGDLALQQQLNEVNTNDRNIAEWLKKLSYYRDKGKLIAIADVAYANGADVTMIPQLLKTFSLSDLAGLGAWNTAGNTIGTVVAQSALIHLSAKKEKNTNAVKERQLLLRLLDDYLYQSIIRQEVRKEINEESTSAETIRKKVNELFYEKAVEMIGRTDVACSIVNIYLPWNRTFEIGVELASKKV
ncbi:DUF4127 family protein [Virgibacillus litoralis]|uniref:DUF4127 domain-containing protein n=1 Tax=Virgibacillus litoralis TaxID=578221 RepID=A0ABS4HC27_9BACI|nr:DUF4127 family protein [Virgibacillus litoralis]MBP1948418.1 hypothetical protein [Virgibacillus litoralis]